MRRYALGQPVNKLIHGCDYNPDQWLDRPDILSKDIEYMKKAGINEATLGIFSWSSYEPYEGEYHFEWLIEIMDKLYENGISTILATPSGARPVWMDQKYPEVMRVDGMGHRNRHGFRHNHCLSSEVFRDKVRTIDRKLAEIAGSHPGLIAWHISNEFGGECFCDLCKEKFRQYLRQRFDNDIHKLNHEWWSSFWSAKYNDFSDIEPPYTNGQNALMGLKLEWHRFTTYNYADYITVEIDAIKEGSPDSNIPVTTNLMQRFYDIDYRKLAQKIDFISWDSYPAFHNDYESYEDTMMMSAFDHALLRCLKKDKPFFLMESAPGHVNWMNYNKLKRPFVHEQFSCQTIASGSDSVQYFQWRRSRGGAEQFHGAVIDHSGTADTRVFRDVAHTGEVLRQLAEIEGSVKKNEAAVIFEWDNWWSIDVSGGFSRETKKYDITCINHWKSLMPFGVEADIISVNDDFEDYKLIIAPMLFLIRPETIEKMKKFVGSGGTLLATYMTGYVNENSLCYEGGFPGDGLKELFGIINEEIDTLYPSDRNGIIMGNESMRVKDYAELIKLIDADVIGTYTDDFYKGLPAITCKKYGKGKAYYQAARIGNEDMGKLARKLVVESGIKIRELPSGIEYHSRLGDDFIYEFYFNIGEETAVVSELCGTDMLTGKGIDGSVTILPKRYIVLKKLAGTDNTNLI